MQVEISERAAAALARRARLMGMTIDEVIDALASDDSPPDMHADLLAFIDSLKPKTPGIVGQRAQTAAFAELLQDPDGTRFDEADSRAFAQEFEARLRELDAD